jgi:hypothetical protein
MAERRDKQDLTPDELAPAPGERGESLTIVGVLGESTEADQVRLFLDVQFRTYYEIPRDAILRRTRVPAERSPLGVDCSAVVVRRGTELAIHRTATRRVEEEFLAGDVTAPKTFTPVVQPHCPSQPAAQPSAQCVFTRFPICSPHSREPICISGPDGYFCPRSWVCPSSPHTCPPDR